MCWIFSSGFWSFSSFSDYPQMITDLMMPPLAVKMSTTSMEQALRPPREEIMTMDFQELVVSIMIPVACPSCPHSFKSKDGKVVSHRSLFPTTWDTVCPSMIFPMLCALTLLDYKPVETLLIYALMIFLESMSWSLQRPLSFWDTHLCLAL